MWQYITKIISDLTGHLTPERIDKRHREKKAWLEKEIRRLHNKPWSARRASLMEKYKNELDKITTHLSS